ncbi:MAG: tRNA-dihydrouridine synthase family protein [Anaerolineales bacterium]|jgi:tRNA-dihydrouridine synthase B
MSDLQPQFWIGKIPVYGDLVLAPMDGFSDLPFRSICREHGSAVSYTAFVGAIELLNGVETAWHELNYLPEERPVVFQLFDSEAERLLQAARDVMRLEPDAIDINMGCSVRRVAGRGAGAGLLRDPIKIERILRSLVRALSIPVTAKIRLGWDDGERNYLEVARAIEAAGASLIAVHGRTRAQGYSGSADWDAIAEIKSAISLPVIGNGDVRTLDDIDRIKAHTSCDAVMIGRAAMGNPWIFQRKPRHHVSVEELSHVIELHLTRMLKFHGQVAGMLRFRKHLKRYLAPMNLPQPTLTGVLRCKDPDVLRKELRDLGLPRPFVMASQSPGSVPLPTEPESSV